MLVRLAEAAGATAERRGRDRPGAGPARRRRYPNAADRASRRWSTSSTGVGLRSARSDGTDDDTAVIAFAHCPFRELAEAHPDLVCSLHRGLVEGFVDAMGDADVEEFRPLAHRHPCQVTVASR